jgi:hypothetical protein
MREGRWPEIEFIGVGCSLGRMPPRGTAKLISRFRNAIHPDCRRTYHRRPDDLAHLVRTPRTLIRSQKITRPFAGISDNQQLRAALRTSRNRKGRRDSRLCSHLSPQRRPPIVPALAQKARWSWLWITGIHPQRLASGSLDPFFSHSLIIERALIFASSRVPKTVLSFGNPIPGR